MVIQYESYYILLYDSYWPTGVKFRKSTKNRLIPRRSVKIVPMCMDIWFACGTCPNTEPPLFEIKLTFEWWSESCLQWFCLGVFTICVLAGWISRTYILFACCMFWESDCRISFWKGFSDKKKVIFWPVERCFWNMDHQ